MATWDHPSFLRPGVQRSTEKLYILLHEFLDIVTLVQTFLMPSKGNSYDQVSQKIAKHQKHFLKAGDVSFFYEQSAFQDNWKPFQISWYKRKLMHPTISAHKQVWFN